MEENTRFYKCPLCGKVIGMIHDPGVPTICCGREMELLVANTTDAAVEKHVPVYEIDGSKIVVSVGSVEHPMTEEHFIMWIALVSDNRTIRKQLHPGEKPEVVFPYAKGATVYVYCNVHGLWKNDVS